MYVTISNRINFTVRFDRTVKLQSDSQYCVLTFGELEQCANISTDYFEVPFNGCFTAEQMTIDCQYDNMATTTFKLYVNGNSFLLNSSEYRMIQTKVLPLVIAFDVIFEEIENAMVYTSATGRQVSAQDLMEEQFIKTFIGITTDNDFRPDLSLIPHSIYGKVLNQLNEIIKNPDIFLENVSTILFD